MSLDPTAAAALRVPRSYADGLYVRGEQGPASRVGVGTVVSVDGYNLCTVLINDEEVTGVMWLGTVAPAVDDVVEVEMRGDLLVIPALNDLDTFLEGMEDQAEHIVSDTDPGAPPPADLQIGGSMRGLDAWQFLDPETANWVRELGSSGQGMRCYQTGPPTFVARNMATIPSGEAGIGPSDTGAAWTSADTASGAYSGAAIVESSTDQSYASSISIKGTWLPDPKPSCVTLRVGGHTLGQQYTAKVWVLVPAGSPDVRLIVQGPGTSAVTTVKDAWVALTISYIAATAEHIIGIATTAAAATTAGTVYVDAFSVAAGATALNPYFDGSTSSSATEKYIWTGTPHLSTSEHWRGPTPPAVPAAGVPPGTTATLWSEEFFEVNPGDTIGFAADLLELANAPTAQLVVSYGSADDSYPPPTDPATVTVTMGAAVTITGTSDIIVSRTTVVPGTVTFPGPGAAEPKTARLGIKLTGNAAGTAQCLVAKTTATLTPKGWPLGSLWMDPDAQIGGLVTVVDNAESVNLNSNDLPSTTADTPIPGAKKAIVTAPAASGGVAVVSFYGSVAFRSAVSALYLKLLVTPGGIVNITQMALPSTVTGTIPFLLRAVAPMAAGDEITVTPVYAYSGTSVTTPHAVLRSGLIVEFHPGATAAGATSDPMIRYWDGDSWRPDLMRAATVDLSQLATTTPTPKTNTTTTLTRSPASLNEGSTLTLTSTTTAGAAGTVTFYRSTSTSGPWTSLGTATIASTKATKTWTADPGTWYFKATYAGSSTYNGSTSAATAATTVLAKVTKTLVIPCSWAQSYQGNGAKLSGTAADDAVQQGWASTTQGNRRALLRFVNTAIPAAADVTSVSLVCKAGGWDYWENGSMPVLVVGSFNNTPNVPATYTATDKYPDRSRIDIPTTTTGNVGGFTANISSWAKTSVKAAIFSGILIGPAPSDSNTWWGYSDEPGKDQFTLKITYDNWE
jgi:hypothetical protein